MLNISTCITFIQQHVKAIQTTS